MNKEFSFGAKQSKIDKRTFKADMVATPLVNIPESATVYLNQDYTNDLCHQKKLGICTACATRMAAEQHFKDEVRLSEYWFYLMYKLSQDGNLSEGSSALSSLRGAHRQGIPSKAIEKKYPLKTDVTYKEFITHFKTTYGGVIPKAVLDDAKKHMIPGYYRVDVDPKAIAKEIGINGKFVICRFDVGENTYTSKAGKVSWAEKDLLPLRKPKNIESGHLWGINSYKGLTTKQRAEGPNSWSKAWGKKGYFYFDFNTQKDYFTEAWAIMDKDSKFVFNNDIRYRMKNADVVALQNVLEKEGFLKMPIGVSYGYFGNLTLSAVKKYQKAHNIYPQSGFVGTLTRLVLNQG